MRPGGAGPGGKPVSVARLIARFARVDRRAGLYHLIRCLGFVHFGRLERLLPPAGAVLDVGCGYGLFPILAGLKGPGRQVLGIDRLEERLAIGRLVLDRLEGPGNVRLERADLEDLPPGPFAAITLTDVLLYRSLEDQARIIASCRRRLAAGGVLLVKEQTRAPAWKAMLVRAQERLVVGAKVRLGGDADWARIAPAGIHLWDAEAMRRALEGLGLRVESRPLHAWSYLSHHLFIGVARPSPPAPAAPGAAARGRAD